MAKQTDLAQTDLAHIRINAAADALFAFMADPGRMDLWSFGTWHTEIAADGLVRGTSIFDGSEIYVRITPYPDQMVVDYLIGADPAALTRRIYARILPSTDADGPAGMAELHLVALRSDHMDDDHWEGLKAAHAFEVRLIKRLIESGFDHRQLPR
ncbi:hypothetical protein N9T38_01355 [SAR116 cluster bacterium]|nr:hypothetical protein [SAR116 cluster bacterium]